MIEKFVLAWEKQKHELRARIKENAPGCYEELLQWLVETLNHGLNDELLDSSKIHRIDDGNYQGTLVFLIPEDTYQPHTYWMVKVYYGSCSGCDTFQSIQDIFESGENTPDEAVSRYMTLALHMLQEMKEV